MSKIIRIVTQIYLILFGLMAFSATYYPGLKRAVLSSGTAMDKATFPDSYTVTNDVDIARSGEKLWGQNTTYLYWGKVYLDGSTYRWGENIDDAAYLKIDGEVLLDDADYKTATFASQTKPAGFYDFELRLYNGGGGAGGQNGAGFNQTKGFAYIKGALEDVNTLSNAETMSVPADDGFGGVFCTEVRPDEYLVVFDGFSYANNEVSATVSVSAAGELFLYYSDTDYGHIATRYNKIKVTDIPAGGVSSQAVTVSGVSGMNYGYFVLVQKTDDIVSAISWGSKLENTTSPVLSSFNVVPGYTSAQISIFLGSVGSNNTSVDVSFDISEVSDFSSTLNFDGLSGTYTTSSQINKTISPLETNKTYYVRYRYKGDSDTIETVSNLVTIQTLLPTSADGTIDVNAINTTTVDFKYSITDFGDDSDWVDFVVQASKDASFATIASQTDAIRYSDKTIVNQNKTITLNGLEANNTYYFRAKIVNEWGFEKYVAFASAVTTLPDVVIDGVSYTFTPDGIDVIAYIGTIGGTDSYAVTLYVNGQASGTQAITAQGPYAFTVAGVATSASLRVTVTSVTGIASEYSINAIKGKDVSCVTNLSNINSVSTSLRVKVGSGVLISKASPLNTIKVSDDTVFKKDGDMYYAVRPGFSRVDEYNVHGALIGSGMIISYPTPVGNGRVFLLSESTVNSRTWNDASSWECLVGTGDYPNGVNDVAILPLYYKANAGQNHSIWINGQVTVGQIYVGDFYSRERYVDILGSDNTNAEIRFETTGEPAGIFTVGGTYETSDARRLFIRLGGDNEARRLKITCVSPTDFDHGYIGVDDLLFYGSRIYFNDRYATIDIPTGSVLRWCNANLDNKDDVVNFGNKHKLMGGGTLWNDSPIGMSVTAFSANSSLDASEFSGLLRTTGHGRIDKGYPSSFNFHSRFTGLNASVELAGYTLPKIMESASGQRSSGRWDIPGYIFTGNPHDSWDARGCADTVGYTHLLPQGGLVFKGGTWVSTIVAWNEHSPGTTLNQTATQVSMNNSFNKVTIDKGASMLFVHNDAMTGMGDVCYMYTNEVRFLSTEHKNKGMFTVRDYGINETKAWKNYLGLWIDDFAQHSIGATGIAAKDNYSYPIIPWMISRYDNNIDRVSFAGVDENNKLARTFYDYPRLAVAQFNDTDNVFQPNHLNLTEDKTINALCYNANSVNDNNSSNKSRLGEGRTLTITSGQLILTRFAEIGTQSMLDAGTAGSLNFPNTAYVFSMHTAESQGTAIRSRITSPYGMAICACDKLSLGGDQTGIDDEIVVNAGNLVLEESARIDVPVRLVSGNATLTVKAPTNMAGQSVHFDDVYQFTGKMNLDYVGSMKVSEIKVGDKVLPPGTYGATGSGASSIDDVHFAGTGSLEVGFNATILLIL